jgi:hypothetical protein
MKWWQMKWLWLTIAGVVLLCAVGVQLFLPSTVVTRVAYGLLLFLGFTTVVIVIRREW